MEWSKIDKEWKKQLDDRSIAPSAAAWDKLSQQLDDREKKTKKIARAKWIGIAACLVVGTLIGLQLLKTEPSNDAIPIVLPHVQQQLVIEDTRREESLEAKREPERELERRAEKEVADEKRTVAPYKSESHKEGIELVISKQLAQVENNIQLPIPYKKEQMDSLTIDEIWVKKAPTKVVVDSNNLLKQVEGEIEVEYRDTKLKKMYDTTKKAVVDISDRRYEK